MELRQLKYFVTVADSKKLSVAASRLFVTQPTLTWNIRQLEKELNTELFYILNRQYILTQEGKLLYEYANDILAITNMIDETFENLSKQQSKNLVVGLNNFFAIRFMDRISKFISENPQINLTLVQSGSKKLQKELVQGNIDIGIVSYPNDYPDILGMIPMSQQIPQSRYSISVVMKENHPLANREKLPFNELLAYPLSSLTDDFVLGKLLEEKSQELGIEPNIIFINDNSDILLQSVKNFNSLLIFPTEFQEYTNWDNLKWIPLEADVTSYPIAIATQLEKEITSEMKIFMEYIL